MMREHRVTNEPHPSGQVDSLYERRTLDLFNIVNNVPSYTESIELSFSILSNRSDRKDKKSDFQSPTLLRATFRMGNPRTLLNLRLLSHYLLVYQQLIVQPSNHSI